MERIEFRLLMLVLCRLARRTINRFDVGQRFRHGVRAECILNDAGTRSHWQVSAGNTLRNRQPMPGTASDLYDFIHAIFLLRAMLPTSHLTHFRSAEPPGRTRYSAVARACYCLAPSAASRVSD